MDITDALDSYLNAKAKVGEWESEFIGKFYRPIADMIIQQALQNARTSPMIDQQKLESRLSPGALRKFRGE